MPRHAALLGRRAFAQNAAQSPQQRPNVIITPPTAPARRSGAAGAFDVLNAVFADRKSCLCGIFALLAAAAALASGTVEAAAPATTAALEEEALARTQAEEAADEKRRAKPAEVTSDGRRIITIAVTDALEGVTDDTGIRDTIAALADALPGYSVRKTTLVEADALSQISEIRPDFVIASTGTSAFFAHASDSPYRIATRKSAAAKSVSRSIGSTIVALKGRADINTLADLRGKTVAATLPTSISGWLAVAGEVKDMGFDAEEFFGRVVFLNTLFPNLTAALWGRTVDAIVLPACFLESLEHTQLADTSDLKVIDEHKDEALACRHSTLLYPDMSIYGFAWTDEDSARDLTIALLSMPLEAPDAVTGSAAPQWRSNVDASALDALFRKLALGPYSLEEQFSLANIIARYRTPIIVALLALLALIGHGIILQYLVKRRTRELSEALQSRKKAEALARENRARLGTLERRNIVNQMSGMIAHEIKSPVGAILNFKAILDFILPEKTREDASVATALSGIESEAVKISGIVDRVRRYAKSQKSAQRPCNLSAITKKAIESVRAAASGEAHIRTQLPEAPATVTGDPLELELLIVNLIKNAWQAQSGGSLAASKKGVHPVIAVGIAVAPGMEKGTEKVLGRRNGSVILTVSNPGPVLDDEAFARLNQIADSVKPEGLGMGLSIVRGICDSHAATLNFRRNPAGGVTARVVFAAADPDNSNKESSAS